MASNVVIKEHKNELSKEQLNYIEELRTLFIEKYKAIRIDEKKVEDYEKLIGKLESIHKNLSYEVLVPVSQSIDTDQPLCFIDGKLTHTNEVFMPIGNTYYAKLSTTEGIAQCNRKMEELKEEILEYEFDKKKFLEKLTFLEESRLQPGQIEIIEFEDDVPESRTHRRDRRGPSKDQKLKQ